MHNNPLQVCDQVGCIPASIGKWEDGVCISLIAIGYTDSPIVILDTVPNVDIMSALITFFWLSRSTKIWSKSSLLDLLLSRKLDHFIRLT